MPSKGMFTQCLAVLLDRPVSVERIRQALGDTPLMGEQKPADTEWLAGKGVVVKFRKKLNGTLLIDTIDKPWPDHMGDPKNEAALFAFWGMSAFGPCTFPYALNRSLAHLESEQDPASQQLAGKAKKHQAFIRLRVSYVMGAGKDAPIVPEGYDACRELVYLTNMVRKLGQLPEAIAYFNPNAEIVADFDELKKMIAVRTENSNLAPAAWITVRPYHIRSRPSERISWTCPTRSSVKSVTRTTSTA